VPSLRYHIVLLSREQSWRCTYRPIEANGKRTRRTEPNTNRPRWTTCVHSRGTSVNRRSTGKTSLTRQELGIAMDNQVDYLRQKTDKRLLNGKGRAADLTSLSWSSRRWHNWRKLPKAVGLLRRWRMVLELSFELSRSAISCSRKYRPTLT